MKVELRAPPVDGFSPEASAAGGEPGQEAEGEGLVESTCNKPLPPAGELRGQELWQDSSRKEPRAQLTTTFFTVTWSPWIAAPATRGCLFSSVHAVLRGPRARFTTRFSASLNAPTVTSIWNPRDTRRERETSDVSPPSHWSESEGNPASFALTPPTPREV